MFFVFLLSRRFFLQLWLQWRPRKEEDVRVGSTTFSASGKTCMWSFAGTRASVGRCSGLHRPHACRRGYTQRPTSVIEPYISGSDLIRWRTNWRHQPAALWFAVTCYKQSTMNQNINTSMLCTRSLLVASYRTCDHSLKRLGSMVVFRCVWSTCAVDANVYFRLKSEKHEMFVSVKSDTTQLNWTQLNSTSSCRHVHSVNNCHVSMNVVTQLTQFVGHGVINKNTTDLAVRCSIGSVEFSWVVSL